MSLTILDKKLPEQIKKVWWIETWIAIIIELLLTAGLTWFFLANAISLLWLLIPAVIVIVTILWGIIFIPLDWQRWSYQVKTEEIEIQHGIIFRKQILIPMIRIQHVETEQGPLLRPKKLVSLNISTAARVHKIDAVDEQEADDLRNQILVLVKAAREDV